MFLDVCVPNQLTRGNLEALPAGSRYRLFTAPADVDTFEQSPVLRRVREIMPVDLVVVPELSATSKSRFTRMTACHRRALADARDAGAAVIFMCADHLISEGTFAAVVRRHDAGSRAVLCTGVWVDRDAFLDALRARGGLRAMASREIVSVALEHLHPSTRALMVDGERTARRPHNVYWNVPGHGILARCFDLHPLMVDPRHRDVMPQETIDGHYVRHACPVREEVHVVVDSDEFVIIEMSRAEDAKVDTVPGGISLWKAASMIGRCDSHQESYWSQPVRLHAHTLGESWTAVEKQSRGFARRARTLGVARRLMTVRHLKRLARLEGVRRQLRRTAKRARRSIVIVVHSASRRMQKWAW